MKAVVTKDQLLSALETALPICAKKSANPTLGRVKLDFGKELRFMATDAVVTVTGARDVVECNDGEAFCISPDLLAEAIRRMPDGPVKLSLSKDRTLEVTAAKRSFRAVTIDPDGFPAEPPMPKGEFSRLPGVVLASAIGRVRFAMSEEDRAHDGVRVLLRDQKIEAQAFDGRKIGCCEVPVDAGGEIDLLLPPRIVAALLSAADRSAGEIGLLSERGVLYLETDADVYRYVSTANASFPDRVRAAVENENGGFFESPTKPLLDAIKYAEMASGREAPAVFVQAGGDRFRIRATDGQRETTDEVPVTCGDVFTAKINPRFFADALVAAGENCKVTRGDNMLRVSSPGFEAGIARLIEQ